jgi:transposase-like protein
MAPATVCCPHPACPARGQAGQDHMRIHSRKERRFLCTECHKTFTATTGPAFYRLRPPAETVPLGARCLPTAVHCTPWALPSASTSGR